MGKHLKRVFVDSGLSGRRCASGSGFFSPRYYHSHWQESKCTDLAFTIETFEADQAQAKATIAALREDLTRLRMSSDAEVCARRGSNPQRVLTALAVSYCAHTTIMKMNSKRMRIQQRRANMSVFFTSGRAPTHRALHLVLPLSLSPSLPLSLSPSLALCLSLSLSLAFMHFQGTRTQFPN